MEIETWFKVEFEDSIGDSFEENTTEEERERLIEEHLEDYCKEHGIDRETITIIKK